jgi:hypothetical protein
VFTNIVDRLTDSVRQSENLWVTACSKWGPNNEFNN